MPRWSIVYKGRAVLGSAGAVWCPDHRHLIKGVFVFYYHENDQGWHSDLAHASVYDDRDAAERVAFSIVTGDPSHVGCVSVEQVPQ